MITTDKRESKLSLIADLLARAEDASTTQAERDLSLQRAQREAVRHNINLAEAAYAQIQRGKAPTPIEREVFIGESGSHGLKARTQFFTDILTIQDCTCLIARDGSRVFAHGMPEDIDLAETLYASLLIQMNVAAEAWLATGEYLGDFDPHHRTLVWSDSAWGMVPERAPSKGVARRSFHKGFMRKVISMMWTEKTNVREEAEQAARDRGDVDDKAVTITALALREKSTAVEEFHQSVIKEKNVRGKWRGDSSGTTNYRAQYAGVEAAEKADLSRRGVTAIGN